MSSYAREVVYKNLAKTYTRQKTSILKEAEKAGYVLVSQTESEVSQASIDAVMSSGLKRFFGDDMEEPDHFQQYLFEVDGVQHGYVQPYFGVVIIPGVHRRVISVSVPVRLAITDKAIFNGPKWVSPDQPEFAKQLHKHHPDLYKVSKKCKFEWAPGWSRIYDNGPGFKITLEWACQLTSLGDGTSELLMQPGRYGGFIAYKVGFKQVQRLAGTIAAALSSDPHAPQEPIFSSPFRSRLRTFMDETSRSDSPGESEGNDPAHT